MAVKDDAALDRVLARLGVDLDRALERLGFPFYVADPGGVIRWVNRAAAELVGDVVGARFTEVVAPEASNRARQELAAVVLGTKERSDVELVVRNRRGEAVHVDVSTVPLVGDGRVVAIFGVAYPTGAAAGADATAGQLTPRQREVLALLAGGRSTREIAAELGIAEETVRNHVRHLLRRLGARSRLAAVLEARRLGLAP